jgi:hypothetical protein
MYCFFFYVVLLFLFVEISTFLCIDSDGAFDAVSLTTL